MRTRSKESGGGTEAAVTSRATRQNHHGGHGQRVRLNDVLGDASRTTHLLSKAAQQAGSEALAVVGRGARTERLC